MTARKLSESAFALFDVHGFDNVTVAGIAAAAGVTSRTFYRYFPSKETVLLSRHCARSYRAGHTDPQMCCPPQNSSSANRTVVVCMPTALAASWMSDSVTVIRCGRVVCSEIAS